MLLPPPRLLSCVIPTLRRPSARSPQALPDVRGWEYKGVESVNGRDAQLWQYQQR